ncbi:hypothetical protein CFC21_086260 [Triticum aestivum]|uniref:F-box domain-containing protein n=3 Tax=Triticum aestivum TaxID=4565 RepID=A0A3B6PHA8_WHEAT|nr:hypothetical protein CFC21_086260 [Triticum aestivum]
MAGGAADGRQIRVDSAVLEHQPESPPRPLPRPHGAREVSSPPLPEELLLDIFRRIPDPADLVLTSAACVTFRRLITDRSFLRQYRKLHAPPLLGFLQYGDNVFHPAVPPHPSAPAARVVALAGDFSFSFVPAPDPAHRWVVRDSRDGRVLLEASPREGYSARGVVFTELAVCDPLHRQYLLLPPIPGDLAAAVEDPLMRIRPHFSETFLAPQGDGNEASTAEETSFRVIWMVQCEARVVGFVFSSSTRQWRAIPSQSWANLLAGFVSSTGLALFYGRQCTCDYFYWLPNCQYDLKMLVLDTLRMEFSVDEPPTEAKNALFLGITMMETGEGRPRMLAGTYDMTCGNHTLWRKNGGSTSQWQKEKMVSLSPGPRDVLRCSIGNYLVLDHFGSSSLEKGLYTVDIETLQLKRVCASVLGSTYCNYPPSLSVPKVSSGIEEEVLEQGVEALRAKGSVDGHQNGGQADVLGVGDGAD